MEKHPGTLKELKESGYQVLPVKEEIRKNVILKLKRKEELFPGIVGYEKTVIPQLVNALLAKHDFILLGLRGQAKTRILRQLPNFLDEFVTAVEGCPVNDNPFQPFCARCRRLSIELGDKLPVTWIPRDRRFQEKLATPDVSIADLIGDIDPIKASREKLDFSSEEVIHYGIIPRTNRGIFAINELPDLQPRIQVGLLNILEEKDFQIKGFPVRMPLDILVVFSANPEDYTNRGNIITPLKDRIDSQITTHYPVSVEDALKITEQEAWTERGTKLELPEFYKTAIERIAFAARKSEFVDQSSGVSARLSISALENIVSNMERRALKTGDKKLFPRICDLYAALPSISGKIELVYEGEQEGAGAIAANLVGRAVKELFLSHFPPPRKPKQTVEEEDYTYSEVLSYFSNRHQIELSDESPFEEYSAALHKVKGLKKLAHSNFPTASPEEEALVMELILEGLHQHNLIAKEHLEKTYRYSDVLATMLKDMEEAD
jgi:magnesium chelatase subunit I